MINWYPGHMKKAMDELVVQLKLVDIVYLLVDARAPISSVNHNLLKTIKDKKVVILFNKDDLTDKKMFLSITKPFFSDYYTLNIDAKNGYNVDKIIPLTRQIMSEKVANLKSKGVNLNRFRAMIIGIPNVGKTTLINRLAKSKMKVENRPGVTKSFTWTRLNESLELMDSPGIMMPKMNFDIGMKMTLIGSIKDEVVPLDEVVVYLLKHLLRYYQICLEKRYKINPNKYDYNSIDSIHECLDEIGRNLNLISKNDQIDYDRLYTFILKDFRCGNLGRIILDWKENE